MGEVESYNPEAMHSFEAMRKKAINDCNRDSEAMKGEETEEEIEAIRIDEDPKGIESMKIAMSETLDKYRNDENFKGTIEKLEEIAQGLGFDGLTMQKDNRDIAVGGYFAYEVDDEVSGTKVKKVGICRNIENKVMVGEKMIKNIKDFFETDEKFAREGLSNIMRHERNHLSGPSGGAMRKSDRETEETIDKDTTDMGIVMDQINEIGNKYEDSLERQTELQRINE